MNLYEITELENKIEQIAKENEGEIPEVLLRELVRVQMEVPAQIEKLCGYVKHLEHFESVCNAEIERIKKLKDRAKNRQVNIKNYMTPFVKNKFEVGTFVLSVRKSERLELDNAYNYKEYEKEKVSLSIDKEQIKKDLKSGKKIKGASIKKHYNLQIK